MTRDCEISESAGRGEAGREAGREAEREEETQEERQEERGKAEAELTSAMTAPMTMEPIETPGGMIREHTGNAHQHKERRPQTA